MEKSRNEKDSTLTVVKPGTSDPYPVVHVYPDGSVRECILEERAHLEEPYGAFDGMRPYVKARFDARTPSGSLAGYCMRKDLPSSTRVAQVENLRPVVVHDYRIGGRVEMDVVCTRGAVYLRVVADRVTPSEGTWALPLVEPLADLLEEASRRAAKVTTRVSTKAKPVQGASAAQFFQVGTVANHVYLLLAGDTGRSEMVLFGPDAERLATALRQAAADAIKM